MEIIKFNKRLQKRLHLDMKNYKEYSQLFSSIEIKLILDDGKFGKFINISEKEKEYYHIYFDGSNKEIKRYPFEVKEKVK